MRATLEPFLHDRSTRKEAARQFLAMIASGNISRAFQEFIADDFRHHNPWFRGDAGSLAKAMAENAARYPQKTLRVVKLLQDGDLVAAFSRVRHAPNQAEFAVVHIFRFDGNKVVELWDVAQEAPQDSPNQFGMF